MGLTIGGSREVDGGELIGQGTYGCVYYPGIKCPGKKGSYEKYATKLEVNDYSLRNELSISQLIRQIKNYKNFFIPIIKTCPIKLASLDNGDIPIEKCELIEKNYGADFVLIYMRYIKGKDLYNFISDIRSKDWSDEKNSNAISFKLIHYYKDLLEGFRLLMNKEIVHMDVKNDNIMITNIGKKSSKPLIIDYGLAINMKNMNELLKKAGDNLLSELRRAFVAYAPSVNYWPLEVHFISFILFKNEYNIAGILSSENIRNIIDDIIQENSIYNRLHDEYKSKLRSQGINFMATFIGKSNIDIIRELVTYYNTWDNFALSIMYLRIIDDMRGLLNSDAKNVKKLKSISPVLLENISTDPRLRLSLLKTRAKIFREKK